MSETTGKSAFTVTDTAKAAGAAPAVVRRGRGTFQHQLRTEQHEREHQQQQQLQQAREMSDTSSTFTTATTTVTLSIMPRTIQASGDANALITTAAATPQEALYRKAKDYEEDLKASLSAPIVNKKDIPLHVTTPPVWRENFGVYDEYTEEADTVRQLLFRSEKRRRYCIIVGDLQSTQRVVTLKLFGHRGLKPFQLQNKVIRLINLSIGRPRPRRTAEGGEEGTNGEAGGGGSAYNGDEGDNAHSETRELEYERTTTTTPEADVVAESVPKENKTVREEEETNERDAATLSSAEVSYSASAPAQPNKDKDSHAHVAPSSVGRATSVAANDEAMLYHDVDHYFENDDEVVPLTVQRTDGAEEGMMNEASLANSPVLTSRYFETLNEYFLREFRFLLGMADVRTQNVTVDISLGAAYYCLPRHCSYTTPLTQATFGEFVERLNQESLQLHFIKDCPPCVSRAVDMECGALNHEANLTSVRIIFFSNERQSRSIARAVWDSEENRFRLLDVENVGVSFRWTIFSLDETFARTAAQKAAAEAAAAARLKTTAGLTTALRAVGEDGPNIDQDMSAAASGEQAETTPCTEEALMRKKTIAYPFEIEFRAFRRWKQHGEHPAGRLAEAILDKLSLAEHNLIHHGSSIGYERMDLSHVCEIDYASEDFNVESIIVDHTARGRPQGTDLLVDNTTSLFIENFAAARQLKEKIEQYGPEAVAAMQNHSNNNYIRGRARMGRGGRGRGLGSDEDASLIMEEALKAPSKLTFFRSRGSTIHWKFRPSRDVEENIAPMTEALHFVQQVLNTANDIERNSVRGGAGPEAI